MLLAASSVGDWQAALLSAPLTGVAIPLLITGTLKAAQPLRTVPTLRALGLPHHPAWVVLLGVCEVAAGVLATGGFRLAIGAVGLLYLGFTAVVWRLRHLPEPVSCGCLGAETGRPGPDHLVANALAVLAAGAALLSRYNDQWTFAEPDDYGHVAVGLVVAALILAVISGVFRPGDNPRRVHTTPFRGPTPDLVGRHPDGQEVTVGVGDRPMVLAFLSSTCATCKTLWPDAGRARLGPRRPLVVVAQSAADERLGSIVDLHPEEVPIVMSTRAWHDYGVTAGPLFVVTGRGPHFAFTADNWPAVRATVKAGPRP